MNPAQNRNIPPLKYDWVFKLAEEFPHLNFVINGGFDSVEKITDILKDEQILEGCMSGRLAMNNTWELAKIDREVYGDLSQDTKTREEIIREYADFVQECND